MQQVKKVVSLPVRYRHESIKSADIVTFFRALGVYERRKQIRSPDVFARHFIGKKMRFFLAFPKWYLKLVSEARFPGLYWYIVTRTLHFDSILSDTLQDGCKQLVILGAGQDSRAYRFQDELSGVTIFEVDFPGTLASKKKNLENYFSSLPEHVTYVPVDFNTDRLDRCLLQNGFNPTKKTSFLWEGVTYYLAERSVNAVLKTIRELSVPGSHLAFDYALKSFIDGDHQSYGAKQLANIWNKGNEPGLFGIDQNMIKTFLEKRQLKMIRDVGPIGLEKMYLTPLLERKKPRVLGCMRIVQCKN